MNHWTKDKQSGEWIILARDTGWEPGDEIEVTRKDGSTSNEIVMNVGGTFIGKYGENEGKQCCFITPAPRQQQQQQPAQPAPVIEDEHIPF